MQKTDRCPYFDLCDKAFDLDGCTDCETRDTEPRFGKQSRNIMDRRSYYYLNRRLT